MEALAISAANLNTIENNLGEVAKELSGVVLNVNDVNDHVNSVESKVSSLNDEIKNLIEEVRQTTIITNARQNIMYNNSIIEKKFGYYDNVRRTTESILDVILNPNLNREALVNLRDNVILNNPNYWLCNALAALTSWILDDKESADRETLKALDKNEEKTSLFFCYVNLKVGRVSSSVNWLNKYLSLEDPTDLDNDFLTVFDMVANGMFGNQERQIFMDKIFGWFGDLNANSVIYNEQIEVWNNFINEFKNDGADFPYLYKLSIDYPIVFNNLNYASTYEPLKKHFNSILIKEKSNKSLNQVINDLIYKYEDNENVYQKDNLKNNLIIENNGNLEKANSIFDKKMKVYNTSIDLISLLSNIIIYSDLYDVSVETQKIALSLCKDYIIKAIERFNSNIKNNEISFRIDEFSDKSSDGTNYDEVRNNLTNYLDNKFDKEDKFSIVALIVVNIIGIIGIFLTMNNSVLFGLLVALLIIGNLLLIYKMSKTRKLLLNEKKRLEMLYINQIDNVMAEILDYGNIMANAKDHYEDLISYLNNLNPVDYMESNGERNLNIGG